MYQKSNWTHLRSAAFEACRNSIDWIENKVCEPREEPGGQRCESYIRIGLPGLKLLSVIITIRLLLLSSNSQKILIYQSYLALSQNVLHKVFTQAGLHEIVLKSRLTTSPLVLRLELALFHLTLFVLSHR